MGVFVIYAYVLVTILTGIAAMMKGAVLPGIAGIVGGGMSAWAGSGLKGSLVVGDAGQRIAGALMAALFVSAGTGLAYYSGFRIGLWGVDFSGSAWCIVGLCIAYLFTADKFAEGTGGSGSRRQKMVAAAILSLVLIVTVWSAYSPGVPSGTSPACAQDAKFVLDTCRGAFRDVTQADAVRTVMSANPNVPEDEKKWIEDTVDLIYKSKAKGLTCGDMMSLELESCKQGEKK
jgi:hypothetical protein